MLSRMPSQISVFEILSAVEGALFESAEDTVLSTAPGIEKAMRLSVFEALDKSVKDTLTAVTLEDLTSEAERNNTYSAQMFYI